MRREEGSERNSAQILQAVVAAHESGQLGEVLCVSRDSIKTCEVTSHKEHVRETPTLVQMRAEAEEVQAQCQKRLDASQALKPQHKAQLRTWHRLKGALLHLRKLDAAKLVAAAQAKKARGDETAAAEPPSAPSAKVDGETPPEFLRRWMGVRDILKSKLAVLSAVSERDVRTRMKDELIRQEGKLILLDQLQEGCMEWPDVCITVQGQSVKADRRWNQGLPDPEYKMEGGREPQTVDEERRCGRFCYFCATLNPPIRVQHKMVDCPKRRRANVREFRPETMAKARTALQAQREVRTHCEGLIHYGR